MPAAPTHQLTRPRVREARAIVCLPPGIDPRRLPPLAAAMLETHQLAVRGPLLYFRARTRRASKLIGLRAGKAAGGPIRWLDLAAMRRHA